MLKVILREDVAGLGKTGDVKQVKDGFARNFLLPRHLALEASDENLKQIETRRKKTEEKAVLEKKKALDLAQRLSSISVTIAVEVNEEGKLYGALSASDIVKAVSVEGIELDKKCVVLKEPIKDLGIYDIEVKLFTEVLSKVKVWVVKK
jgi:large subunit ribosomal protein L9